MEKPNCTHCKDIIGRKCQYCSCHVCGGQDSPDQQIMCDECDMAYHLWCLKPPLQSVPEEDDWFCPDCHNDRSEVVHAGESLKASKKKAKMASAQGQCKRDWGKGMACVGRTKVCTIVPSDHVGPIPGIEVGMMWKYRVQVSEAGVHRPHVAGIHGTEKKGAYSIVLSGGYEDDKDDGDEFIYTEISPATSAPRSNPAIRPSPRMNKALALNCAAAISTKGATAENWKKGRPVRVVRNCKGRKHSSYAPEEGNRYDGLYKVVKYWPEKGESGFLVWRYRLRRDDPTPAPWTKEGKKLIKEKGFEMVYPDGYVPPEETEKKKGKKRPPSENAKDEQQLCAEENDGEQQPSTNKKKKKKAEGVEYKIPEKAEKNMDQDKSNQALWKECRDVASKEGGPAFIKKVEETFLCICCQEVVWQPVTTSCGHNFCHSCLQRSFQAEVFTCPTCRFQLTSKTFSVNSKLGNALEVLFPGYGSGR
ncbi:UHRF2 [Cordylochernes scorpioides]|uniref:RING-type E3 ubiquitin transferase n=1 Tax=Cordylochernes scorpioides TaxID=51811 RepID=A0ABY6KZM1_9ARAC|nr:UHRF2 [Cordylochernes scorpioides]